MAVDSWPLTNVFTINNVSSAVWRELIGEQINLITEADDGILRIAARRNAIQPFAGGDKFNINTVISSGETEVEYDPAAVDPTTTVGTTGYQYLAPSEYKYYGRTKNVIFPQDLAELVKTPRALQDVFQTAYMANIKGMLENLANSSATPGGFWSHTLVDPANGITNAVAMFADTVQDFAGVDVSEKTMFKPTIVDAADTAGTLLLKSTIQKFLNGCARQGEGGVTDIFTDQVCWEKIRSLMISDSILAAPSIKDDLGIMNTLVYAGVDIHWSRFLALGTIWDVSSTTTSETPFLGIDFNSVRLRVKPGGDIGGDEYGLFHRKNMPTLSETRVKFYQRLAMLAQWCFIGSRRTSGQMEGMTL